MTYRLTATVEEHEEPILDRTLYCAAVEVYKDDTYFMTIRAQLYCLDAEKAWEMAEAIKEDAEHGFGVERDHA